MLDPKYIKRLARIMSGEGVTELEIDDQENNLRVCLKRGDLSPAQSAPGPVVQLMGGSAPLAPVPGVPASAGEAPATSGGGELPPGTEMIESPMVGTFYRSPSPEAAPFVEVGSRVDEETTVCILEAMKVMNEIKAEKRGEITEFLVENGDPVEFGQPLMLIKRV
jgi:acetyl-CoA carboxylase biotin carboxyl carrier protein